eukprot:scaffold15281_cov109-Skeletonema_dohrnii-CCMP3373.AAC.2
MLFVVVLYGPVLLLTILVHEFGHVFATKRQGGEVGGVVLWLAWGSGVFIATLLLYSLMPALSIIVAFINSHHSFVKTISYQPLGGFALCGPTESLSGELKVALAGPLTHIPQMFFWWMIYLLVKYEFDMTGNVTGIWPSFSIFLKTMSTGPAGFFQVLAGEAVWLNIILCGFNLCIPAYPLDGGRVFAAALMLKLKVEPLKAAFVTAMTAMAISAFMVAYAIVRLFTGGASFSLYLGLVGLYVFHESFELNSAVKRNDLKNHPIFGGKVYQSGGANSASSSSDGGDLTMAEVSAPADIPAEEGVMA